MYVKVFVAASHGYFHNDFLYFKKMNDLLVKQDLIFTNKSYLLSFCDEDTNKHIFPDFVVTIGCSQIFIFCGFYHPVVVKISIWIRSKDARPVKALVILGVLAIQS